MHRKNDNTLKVVTIKILTFLSGCFLALLKAVCSPLIKKVLAVNMHLVERDCNVLFTWSGKCTLAPSPGESQVLSCSRLRDKIWEWPGDKAKCTYYANIIAQEHIYQKLCSAWPNLPRPTKYYAGLIYQGLQNIMLANLPRPTKYYAVLIYQGLQNIMLA